MEELHRGNQTLVVHGYPGCNHSGLLAALGTATVSHSIFACPVGFTDLDSSRDAYLHAYEGAHRDTDDDLYTHAHKGADRYAGHDAYACRGAHYRRLH
jgi:hypothetical protein